MYYSGQYPNYHKIHACPIYPQVTQWTARSYELPSFVLGFLPCPWNQGKGSTTLDINIDYKTMQPCFHSQQVCWSGNIDSLGQPCNAEAGKWHTRGCSVENAILSMPSEARGYKHQTTGT